MHRNTYKIALGGLVSAAAVAIMFFGSILPFATFISPAVASFSVLYFCIEYNRRTALLVYAVIGLLSMLLAPDKEQALLFVFLLGYYPIAKSLIEKLHSKVLAWVLKIVLCDTTMLALYYIITQVFVIEAVRDELADYTAVLLIVMIILGNFTFAIFDLAMTRLSVYYEVKIRPRIKHSQ
ncbi:MAG: hypothetical protein RSD35_09595 [Oscillospiraceae bacterium]